MDPEIRQIAMAAGKRLKQRLRTADQQWQQVASQGRLDLAVAEALDEAMNALRQTDLWGPGNRMASNEFWQEAESWLRHGALQVRARTKPRGYAGDFVMLRSICELTRCDHPLGGAMDQYFLNEAAPRAVRQRTNLVAERLVQRCGRFPNAPLRIVSVGSGPAIELQQALQALGREERHRVRITLLDLDQQALDYARETLLPMLDCAEQLKVLRVNLARLSGNASIAAELAPADYLFCPGFFDYLDTDAAATMLDLFSRSLAPGGEMTVFNFGPANPSRAYMEWIGNWYLTYRDEAAMWQLADTVDCAGNWDVHSIEQGTLIELTMRRDA